MTSTLSRRGGGLLAVMLVAAFMGQFDFFVVNVAVPAIGESLHASEVELELVVGGYAFAYASGLIIGGRLGDHYGHRRIYVLGLILFAVTSALCGLAPTALWLVIARVLQGFAAAVMIPQVLAIINTALPGQRRGWAMGWYGAATGTGSIAGQILGGWFIDVDLLGLGWRAIFLINVPIAAITVVAALILVLQTRRSNGSRLDAPAAFGLGLGLALILAPFVLGREQGWPWWLWAFAVAGAGLLWLVLRAENRRAARGEEPIIDTRLLTLPSLARGSLASVAFMLFFASFMFRLTLVLQRGEHLAPLQAGLVFVPSGITFVTSSLLMRGWVARNRERAIRTGVLVTGVGLLVAMAGLFSEALPTVPLLVAAVCLTGFGNGLVLPTLIGYALSDIPPQRAGVASGIVTAAQQFAASAGVAILGALYFSLAAGAGDQQAMAWTLIIDLVLLAAVALIAGRRSRQSVGRERDLKATKKW
ncbi:EmrB/QacA subfamily drug resistance transporter [Microbacterium resistens]|uniref:EmrB/QacA subfamily drug resistance transporter n=1 Tax=Microbacterium resistens TaxID=156977 RepID=A0ABU1S8X3_9MICO|nr:MFS transporter [Microbacterium resistens]MDR6866054.1 EmrB/QacA subfamily drug resistance transporter [Microbacterium resistens]